MPHMPCITGMEASCGTTLGVLAVITSHGGVLVLPLAFRGDNTLAGHRDGHSGWQLLRCIALAAMVCQGCGSSAGLGARARGTNISNRYSWLEICACPWRGLQVVASGLLSEKSLTATATCALEHQAPGCGAVPQACSVKLGGGALQVL